MSSLRSSISSRITSRMIFLRGGAPPMPPPAAMSPTVAGWSPPPGGLVDEDEGGRGPREEAPAYMEAVPGPPPPPAPIISPTGDLRKCVEEADLCIRDGGTAVKPLAAPGPRMDGAKPRGGEVAQPGSSPGGPAPSLRIWIALDS